MMSLPVFLLARLDEDEAAEVRGWAAVESAVAGGDIPPRNEARHARVLADVEAKRRIVELGPTPCPMREPAYDGDDDLGAQHHYPDAGWAQYPHYEACANCAESAAADHVWRTTLRLLALPYADHPDYRAEWKP